MQHRFILALGLGTALLAGCSSLDAMFQGDKVDYRGQSTKTNPLEVPPDLSQIQRDGRFAPAGAVGTVSASSFQSGVAPQASSTAANPAVVAPTTVGEFRYMRNGNQRWLVTSLPPEKIWPQMREFWQERGFTLAVDSAEAGVMETNWAENRAKLDDGVFRRTVGRFLNSLYSTGERDKYRVRVERAPAANGTEIYLTHFGLQEVFTSQQQDQTRWTARPNDPQLEGELLQRLMVKLGAKPDDAKQVVVAAATSAQASTPAAGGERARMVGGEKSTALQLDDNFDRAWRRVGTALDRSGFTVEDRDRSVGTYFVRYADPRHVGKEEPGVFSRMFGGTNDAAPVRYRVVVKGEGERTNVTVQSDQGLADTGDNAQRIAKLLLDELR